MAGLRLGDACVEVPWMYSAVQLIQSFDELGDEGAVGLPA